MGSGTGRRSAGIRLGGVAALVAVSLAGLATAGCERDPTGRDGTLSAAEFIEIIVALRTAEREVEREVIADSVEVEYARRKAAILDRHDASEEDLHRFLEAHHTRPGLMSTVWDSITQRLRTAPAEYGEPPYPDDGW